jgi:hypothetical protein
MNLFSLNITRSPHAPRTPHQSAAAPIMSATPHESTNPPIHSLIDALSIDCREGISFSVFSVGGPTFAP